MQNKIVISDDIISLSWSCEDDENINDFSSAHLNIILNETNENIGIIFFELGRSKLNNVNYRIFTNHRRNGYATRALYLLKELIKENSFKGDKNLYLIPTNEYSEKVILNNDGELIHLFNNSNEVEELKIYKIKIGN